MQNDLYWCNEKDEDYIVPPHFGRPDSIICPSEDKFVMTLETGKQISQLGLIHMSEGFQTVDKSNYLDKPWSFNVSSLDEIIGVQVTDYHHSDENVKYEGIVEKEKKGSAPVSDCCLEGGFF